MTPEADQLITLSPRLRHRKVGEEGVLVNLDTDRVIVVNEVGLYIVQALQRPMTRQALTQVITEEFAISVETAKEDLKHYLRQLADNQLLETPAFPVAG